MRHTSKVAFTQGYDPRPARQQVYCSVAFDYLTWTAFKNSVDVIDGNTGTVATVVAAPAGISTARPTTAYSRPTERSRPGTPIDEQVLSVRDGVLPGYKVGLIHGSLAPRASSTGGPSPRRRKSATRLHPSSPRREWKDEQDRDGGGADVSAMR